MTNICPAGKQALFCFFLSVFIFTVSFFSGRVLGFSSELWALTCWGPALYFCLFNFILRYCYTGFIYEVSIRSAFLGAVFSLGIFLVTFDNGWRVFGLYTVILSFFHFSEFMSVALTNPRTLSVNSFILNHSVQYSVAAVSSWIEWGVEYYFFPDMKTYFWLSYVGVVICITGELLRKTAMFTAKTNFNHTLLPATSYADPVAYASDNGVVKIEDLKRLMSNSKSPGTGKQRDARDDSRRSRSFIFVQFVKRPDHVLVTHGVYSICRHPSYVGWFYWSIGTQITLLNPVCVIMYTLASWMFFRERLIAEELTLLTFFGPQYVDYQKKVGTGLPFIPGYIPKNTGQNVRENHWSY